jgi:hypothetical protein
MSDTFNKVTKKRSSVSSVDGTIKSIPAQDENKKVEKKGSIGSSFLDDTSKPVPNQDVNHKRTKSGETIQQQMKRQHGKVQRASLHIFDDRVFLADDEVDAERLLRINTTSNPIAKKINPILATAIKIFDIGLSSFRAVFNIFMWKDPNLSYCVMVLIFVLMIVVLIFPWRPFFFLVGIGLGPQNKLLVPWYLTKKQRRLKEKQRQLKEEEEQKMQGESEPLLTPPKPRRRRISIGSTRSSSNGDSDLPKTLKAKQRRQSEAMKEEVHLDHPLLLRNNMQMKPDGKSRQVIVPSVPFRYNRFYDWPPDPASTKVKYKNWK